jgi:hypothetical protein
MTDPLASAPAPVTEEQAPAVNENVFTFRIPNTETDIATDLTLIPAEHRMHLLKGAVRAYITNRVNQVNVKHTAKVRAFDAYDEAMKADPLQTAVAKPEGERPTVDLLAPAAAARADLYAGNLRTPGEGGKARETKDPLVKAVTDVVVRELFNKQRAVVKDYKWTDAVKAVGGDGQKYLEARIAEKVAEGADAAVLAKFMDERYIKPARIMLGLDTNKATRDQSIL